MQIDSKYIIGLGCLLTLSAFSFTVEAQQDTLVQKVTVQHRNGKEITGHVKDAVTGKPLSGINVSIAGYSAAITNDKGNFSIEVPYLNSTILITHEAYQTKEHALRGKNEVVISLYEDGYPSFYNEVSLPGGAILESQSPYAAKTVNLEQSRWEVTANETPGTFLQSRVSGLYSTRRSGAANSDATLWLRGFNSLYATNKPLIVVDGMLYDNEDYSSELIGNNFNSAIANIDIKDIEDVTILKDGSSLYGTKGGNGVLMIRTTHTKELTTKMDFSVSGGFNQQPKSLPLMGAAAYRTYLSQLLQTKGLTQSEIQSQPFMNDNSGSQNYYTYHNDTHWQNEVMNNSYNQNYYLKVTGGDNIAKYALSLGLSDNDGIVQSTSQSKYNMRLNGDLNLTPKLTMQANLSFYYVESNIRNQGFQLTTNPLYLGLTKAPFLAPHEYSATGEQSPNLADTDIFNVSNPAVLVSDKTIGINRAYRFSGNLQFGYKLGKNLNLASILGLTYDKARENFFFPNKGIASDTLKTAVALNRSGSEIQRLFSMYNDTYLNFAKSYLDKHNLKVRVGMRTQTNEAESDFGLGFNSPTDDFLSVGAGTATLRQIGGSLGKWNWINLYFGTDYNYLGKYFVSINMALDGSSRFGDQARKGSVSLANEKFAYMPSIAAGWLISSENFMADQNTVDLLKLRASYGLSGNDDIGNSTARSYYVSQNLLGTQGLVRGNIGNPYLQWETVKKANLGLDVSLLNQRINASFDAFINNTSNMVIFEPANAYTGMSYVINNSGAMQTKGYELAVNSRVINQSMLKLDLGINLSKYKNRVTSLPVDEIITNYGGATFITRRGEEANLFYGLESNGIFTTAAQAAASSLMRRLPDASLVPFSGGDVHFTDKNNDKVIDENDRTIIGNPNPEWFGMISSAVTYKRVSLSALFSFSLGNELYNGTRNSLEKMSGFENQTLAVLNRWRADGQQTATPQAVWGDPMGNNLFSDRWIEDGSYLRLRTIALSYTMPIENKIIKSAKFYLSANNLFTVTNYLGYDPEFSAGGSLFAQGVDIGLTPQYKTFQLGFRLGL